MFKQGGKEGAAVFEYIRRLIQWANYLQAFSIAAQIFQDKKQIKLPDFEKVEALKEIRKYLAETTKMMKQHEDNQSI